MACEHLANRGERGEAHRLGAAVLEDEHVGGCDADRRGELPENLDAPMITVCNVGNASISGMLVLKSLGYRNVKSMNGGTAGWMDRGLPTE